MFYFTSRTSGAGNFVAAACQGGLRHQEQVPCDLKGGGYVEEKQYKCC